MKFAWLGCFLLCSRILMAGMPDQETNVNARYTVESVEFAGGQPDELGTGLRGELKRLIGEKLDPAALDDLGSRIRRELHVHAVTHRVLRGQTPGHVRVVFEVRGIPARFEASVPKLLYASQGGFTGAVEGTAALGSQALTFGVVSDGDALTERYSGIFARYEKKKLGSDKVRLRVTFEDYHDQWNHTAAQALTPAEQGLTSGLYRTRQNIEPVVTVLLARSLSLGFGASFERFDEPFPAARTESANSMVTTLRYHRRLEGSDANQQDWDAGYSLRAATNFLGSDYAYARHEGTVRYTNKWGRNQIEDDLTVGDITGRAPLFERFVLGNGALLRGWNRFELDPLGGDHMVHNSVDYRYSILDVFFDSGAIWDTGEAAVLRHSLGAGVRRNGLFVALAVPVKNGHVAPIFMVGMNY